MKAEKTRAFLDRLDCCACSRVYEIIEKGICAPDCGKEYRLDDEIQNELTEIERLANIGRDLEYTNTIKYIGNIPTVEHVQELAKIWREKEVVE